MDLGGAGVRVAFFSWFIPFHNQPPVVIADLLPLRPFAPTTGRLPLAMSETIDALVYSLFPLDGSVIAQESATFTP